MRGDLVAVVGPTAVGKSAVALRLAQDFEGEIVNLDSRQMVRGLDIGTAKPSRADRRVVPHHLIDISDPDESPGLAEVQALAYAAIDDCLRRKRTPIAVGGSGQYVRAVLAGWSIPRVAPDLELRATLLALAEREGSEALHRRLAAVDPVAAGRIDPRNVRRIIRALEVHQHTGRPISELQGRSAPPYRQAVVGLYMPRQMLYERIDRRIEAMLAAGLEAEVRALVAAGHGFERRAMSSVGYAEWQGYLLGRIDRDEVVRLIRRSTRRLVRQQATWFRADDATITWFDMSSDDYGSVRGWVLAFLAAGG